MCFSPSLAIGRPQGAPYTGRVATRSGGPRVNHRPTTIRTPYESGLSKSWERPTLITLGIVQKEDPTRGATSTTAQVPVGSRTAKEPFDDALIVLADSARDRIANDVSGIGIGGVPSRTTIPLIVPVPSPTSWVVPSACGEDEHPATRLTTPRRTRPDHRHRTRTVCHARWQRLSSSALGLWTASYQWGYRPGPGAEWRNSARRGPADGTLVKARSKSESCKKLSFSHIRDYSRQSREDDMGTDRKPTDVTPVRAHNGGVEGPPKIWRKLRTNPRVAAGASFAL